MVRYRTFQLRSERQRSGEDSWRRLTYAVTLKISPSKVRGRLFPSDRPIYLVLQNDALASKIGFENTAEKFGLPTPYPRPTPHPPTQPHQVKTTATLTPGTRHDEKPGCRAHTHLRVLARAHFAQAESTHAVYFQADVKSAAICGLKILKPSSK